MRRGVFLPPFGTFGDPAVLVDLAVAAEGRGWDGFFLWDHLMHRVDGPYVDAWIALAAIAARTDRIRIGPLITPLPRRRPWKLAREAVSLDHLSHGRVVLGVGIGTDHSREFSAFGEPSDVRTRAELLDEDWTSSRSSGRGSRSTLPAAIFTSTAHAFSPVHSSNPAFPSGAAPTGPTGRPFGEPPATTASSPSATYHPRPSQTS